MQQGDCLQVPFLIAAVAAAGFAVRSVAAAVAVQSEADGEPAIQCKKEEMTSYHFNHEAAKSNIALA